MESTSRSGFAGRHFQSLPDGRRVFQADIPWSGHYVIPDDGTEQRLFRKQSWVNRLVFPALLVSVGVAWSFRELVGAYTPVLLGGSYLLLMSAARWIFFHTELRDLQKVDVSSAVSSYYKRLSENLRLHAKDSLPNDAISILLDIPESSDKIVLLKYTEAFRNLLRVTRDGSVVWRAELPVPSDVYTNVEWKDGQLQGFSRSCSVVVLDLNTGRILSGTAAPSK